MNKGFSAVFVLIVAGALFSLFISQNQALNSQQKTQIAWIENETAAYWRTAIENAFDQTIFDNLKIQTALQNPDGETAKTVINSQLLAAIEQIESEQPFISFFAVDITPDTYDLALINPRYPISLQGLNERSAAFFVSTPAGTIGHYAFTGGLLKNQAIAAEITVGSVKTFFLVPIDYEQTALVIS